MVQKPARYIGCEDGAITPTYGPDTVVVAARLPGHLRGGTAQPGPADPLRVAQRGAGHGRRALLRALDRHGSPDAGARRARCSRSKPTAPPTSSTCWPSTCRPNSSTPTCSTASTWPACPCGRPSAPTSTRWSCAGGHCTFNPEPLADFVDFFVIGDGEEVDLRDHRGRARCDRGEPGRADAARARPRCRACTSRRCTTSCTTATSSRRWRRATPTCRRASTSARSPTWARGRIRATQLVPLTEVVHDRLNVEIFRGCTRGCRFCQAGMITRPVRERPAAQVRQMV